ncbi:MAG: DUF116 domain-containing protein [Nitrospirae bacterium]|nr:DUF116 domain-containing protein [Nitrospirota bacterium]
MISRKWMRGFILKILYPILMIIGSFFKHKKEGFQSFIINFNNSLVKKEKFNPKKILLLLPHCLQMDECDIRLTYNIYNCKRCGRCEIKDLIQIAEENNLTLSVATGGSLARRIVNNTKPDAIVAVACENDLSSGIADIYPLPVLGIPNIRPFGPCINTMVDLSKVREYIEFFAKKSEN